MGFIAHIIYSCSGLLQWEVFSAGTTPYRSGKAAGERTEDGATHKINAASAPKIIIMGTTSIGQQL